MADVAPGKAQSQLVARNRVFDELDLIVAAREEKTLRLREARLAQEAHDRPATKVAKRATKT
jgi:hypothetical protein